MTTYKGVGVYAGRVIGPVLQMPKPIEEPKDGLRLSGETAEAAAPAEAAVEADVPFGM